MSHEFHSLPTITALLVVPPFFWREKLACVPLRAKHLQLKTSIGPKEKVSVRRPKDNALFFTDLYQDP